MPAEYRTIVADPPWRYRKDGVSQVGVLTGDRYARRAEQMYETMPNAEIAAIPVREWVDKDAMCFLWVTMPRLYGERNDRSISPADILEAWGFEYVTALVWHKLGSPGLGNYFRTDTEVCLFGKRGRVAPPPELRISNHFAAPRTQHSSKPDRFYEIVERVSPEPRLELFARRRRVGWDVWGNEAPPESEALTQTHLGLLG